MQMPPEDRAHQVDQFIQALVHSPSTVFNPWYETDDQDQGPDGPAIRRRYLRTYLLSRPCPRFVLVAEAIGYQGGRFSGIAMTSERMLLGHHPAAGPQDILGVDAPPIQRTSNPCRAPNAMVEGRGFTEPTATMVWRALWGDLRLDPYDFVLWNSVPWHPHRPQNRLANRAPNKAEQQAGEVHVHGLHALFPSAKWIAVGKKAREALDELGIPARCVRHPANGGANAFRAGVRNVIRP